MQLNLNGKKFKFRYCCECGRKDVFIYDASTHPKHYAGWNVEWEFHRTFHRSDKVLSQITEFLKEIYPCLKQIDKGM